MANYKVNLVPLPTEEEREVEFEDVDLGFNQFGWLIFTDDKREPIGAFGPGTVRYFVRTDEGSDLEIVDAVPSNVVSIN